VGRNEANIQDESKESKRFQRKISRPLSPKASVAEQSSSATGQAADPPILLHSLRRFLAGEMAEWLKAHAWKACIPQGIQGSNPCLSATLSTKIFRVK
jgi:hypothetical protein